jgi:hypothetical protein
MVLTAAGFYARSTAPAASTTSRRAGNVRWPVDLGGQLRVHLGESVAHRRFGAVFGWSAHRQRPDPIQAIIGSIEAMMQRRTKEGDRLRPAPDPNDHAAPRGPARVVKGGAWAPAIAERRSQ